MILDDMVKKKKNENIWILYKIWRETDWFIDVEKRYKKKKKISENNK